MTLQVFIVDSSVVTILNGVRRKEGEGKIASMRGGNNAVW